MAWCASVSAQSVTTFELVADDAGLGANATIPNNWGGHQPRIIRQSDDTIRLLYLKTVNGVLQWQLKHRLSANNWVDDAPATATFDDATLLRNPLNDNAYVVAWPNSVPTLYNITTAAAPAAVPGNWPNIIASYRQYQNTGIGPDGKLCLKVAYEPSANPPTSATNTLYSCANFDNGTNTLTWPATPVSHYIGARYVYDYLHVDPAGRAPGLYGTSKRDVYPSASNVPSAGDYVKNALRIYSTGLSADTDWSQYDFVREIYAPPGATHAASTALQDALIDSKGRLFASYAVSNPVADTAQGLFLHVSDYQGNTLYQGAWTGAALDQYGSTRIYEDSNHHLWLLWANQSNRYPEVKIYPIIETANPTAFSLGTAVNLSSAFHEVVPDGTNGYIFYLATARGGNSPSQYIDAIFNACGSLQYNVNHTTPIDKSQCYTEGKQKVYYTRITLP
jgi:hypothetical protein